jgi:hypothetical protein
MEAAKAQNWAVELQEKKKIVVVVIVVTKRCAE